MKPKKDLTFGPDIELANRVKNRSRSRHRSDDELAQARKRKEAREEALKHLAEKSQAVPTTLAWALDAFEGDKK